MITRMLLLASIFLLLSCSSWFFKNNEEPNVFTAVSIIAVESHLIKTNYDIVGYAGFIPIKKPASYLYEIQIRLAVYDEPATWTRPLFVSLHSPGNPENPIIHDLPLTQHTGGPFPEFTTQVEVKNKGQVRLILGIMDATGKIVYDPTQ